MVKKAHSVYKKLVESAESLEKNNGELFKKLCKNKFEVLRLLIRVVEEADPYAKGHSLKVYKHVMKMAKRLKLKKKNIEVIGTAALLHDVGKIAIDTKILTKKGKLTKEEYTRVQIHPTIGADIVGEIENLKASCPDILHHHARFSGGGYPQNDCKYNDIPLGSRLIAVADSYDAMTSDRPYRKAYTREHAIKELKRLAGKQYDPKIVNIFIKILNQEK